VIKNEELTGKLRCVLKDAQIVATSIPLTPEIQLYLMSEKYPRRPITDDERSFLMDEPPYWAFCWSSGQVLAEWIWKFPEVVYGKRVLDFGSGSGVTAIAAALCGAREVVALDSDILAIEAILANAELNRVSLKIARDLSAVRGHFDVVLAADILYDKNNFPLLDTFIDLAYRVIVADSRVKDLSEPYKKIGSGVAITCPDLDEPEEFKNVAVFAYPS
jgi:predicted nicotinamide N-methyase